MNGLSAASSTEVKYPPNVGANRGVSPESPECERLYESKHDKKLVRILTVILYMISVSLGAILLSLYYIFLWKNPHTHHYLMMKNSENMTIDDTIPPLVLELDSNPISKDLFQTEIDEMGDVITTFPKGARGIPPIARSENSQNNNYKQLDENRDRKKREIRRDAILDMSLRRKRRHIQRK